MQEYQKYIDTSKDGFKALETVIAFSCSRCGLCAAICPKQSIEMRDAVPTLVGDCNNCGLCYLACPRSFFPLSRVKQRWFGPESTEVEQRVGCCVDAFTSRSLDDEIFETAATGGTTSALLCHMLETHMVDAVLHLESIHKDRFLCHHAQPRVSTTRVEVLAGAKSKNQINPILHELKKLEGYERCAVVGLSCHVDGIRKLQVIREDSELRSVFKGLAGVADRLVKNVAYVIGINCFSNTKPGAIDTIYQSFGITEADVIKHAEDTKKTLYQKLNEGKTFTWFVQDNIVTKQGQEFTFNYTDYMDTTIPMGCMVCPSFIVCKEADVSIGITAGETKLREFGYNSIFVRNPEIADALNAMADKGMLLKRPMCLSKAKLVRKFVEKVIPTKDMLGFKGYIETGTWNPSDDIFKRGGSAQSGKIYGLQRLLLAQTVKKNIMYTPARKALQAAGKHVPEYL